MLPAPKKVGDRILIENTYIVEFPLGSDVTNRFGSITKSLKASHDIDSSKVKERCTIQSSLFSGVSFTVNDNHPIEAIEIIKDAIAIYPVYLIPGPKPVKTTFIYDTLYGSGADSINSYNMTGINQVQNNFNNFGAGVRVRKLVFFCEPARTECCLLYRWLLLIQVFIINIQLLVVVLGQDAKLHLVMVKIKMDLHIKNR